MNLLSPLLLVLAPIPQDSLLSDHHHFASPTDGWTRGIDVCWSAEHQAFCVVWDRLTEAGHSLICFTTLGPDGFPLSPVEVLATVPLPSDVTAGPAMTDTNEGRDLIVSWATTDGYYDDVHTNWVRREPSGWKIVAKELTTHGSRVFGLDVGYGDGIYAFAGGGIVAIGDAYGDVWAARYDLEQEALPGGTAYTIRSAGMQWLDQDPTRFDGFPSVPRAATGLVVWQRGSGYQADVVGRGYNGNPLQDEVGVFEILADPELPETRPWAAGVADVGVVAQVVHPDGSSDQVIAGLQYDPSCGPQAYCVTGVSGLSGSWPGVYEGPPALGLVADERYVYGSSYDVFGERGIAGYGVEGDPYFPSCEPGGVFVVDEIYLPELRISESALAPSGVALVVWAGHAAGYPQPEARGALVRTCD